MTLFREMTWVDRSTPADLARKGFLSLLTLVCFAFLAACGSSGAPATASYTIGGTVEDLSGTGLVLRDNGGDKLPVTESGPFTFTTTVTRGGTYQVAVLDQPSSPAQTCVVTDGNGTASANVTNVQVVCTTNPTSSFGVNSLNGTYVFSSAELDSETGTPFVAMMGSLTANGMGRVTGGTVDLVGYPPILGAAGPQSITGGSYTVGADGRGQIEFDTTIGGGAIAFTLDFVLMSNSHGLVIEYDTNGNGSGTLDLQTAITQSQLAGSYAFAFSGNTVPSAGNGPAVPIATVGAFTLDSTGTVSTGQEDVNNAGSYPGAPSQILPSSAVTLGTTPATATIASSAGTSYTFDVYPIDSGHLKFIENDSKQLLSGDVYSQGSSIPIGQIVFTLGGEDTSAIPSALSFASGGWLTNSSTTITAGLEDFTSEAGSTTQDTTVSGSFSAVSGGRSVLDLAGFVNSIANSAGTYTFAAYPFTLSGGGSGIQLLEIDGVGITSGVAYAQTGTTLPVSQAYGLDLSDLSPNEVNMATINIEGDNIAEFTTTASGLMGTVDSNLFSGATLSLGKPLTGTFPSPVDSNGRGTASTNYFDFDFYVVNSSMLLLLETNATTGTPGTGVFELQNPGGSPGAEKGVPAVHPRFHAHAAQKK